MRVSLLIVEDNDQKFGRVSEVLTNTLATFDLEITRADACNTAIAALSARTFDAVILDIFLPAMRGGSTSADAARNIVQMANSGSMPGAPIMFGLTDHSDLLRPEDKAFFEANLFHVLQFHWIDTIWASVLSARIEFLLTHRGFSTFKIAERFYTDICIITARHENEYLPIRDAMDWYGPTHDSHPLFPGLALTRGAIKLSNDVSQLATVICVGEKGLAATAAVTATALLALRPRFIAMLGMCCAFTHNSPHAKLGDVCVALEAVSWDSGRYETKGKKTKFFPEQRTVTARFGVAAALHVAIENQHADICKDLSRYWRKQTCAKRLAKADRTKSALHCGQFLSGLSVVDSPSKKRELAKRFAGGLALDMEVHGFYSACIKSPISKSQFLAIKGVADLGDGEKQTGKFDAVQPTASRLSWIAFDRLIAPKV